MTLKYLPNAFSIAAGSILTQAYFSLKSWSECVIQCSLKITCMEGKSINGVEAFAEKARQLLYLNLVPQQFTYYVIFRKHPALLLTQ